MARLLESQQAYFHFWNELGHLRQPPGKCGDDGGFLGSFHLQLADQPNCDDQDAYLSGTVEDRDDEPSCLRQGSVLSIHGNDVLTLPSQVVNSDACQICSGPHPTDTATAAPTPQRLVATMAILHSVMAY
jgi:hypothetical protein